MWPKTHLLKNAMKSKCFKHHLGGYNRRVEKSLLTRKANEMAFSLLERLVSDYKEDSLIIKNKILIDAILNYTETG